MRPSSEAQSPAHFISQTKKQLTVSVCWTPSVESHPIIPLVQSVGHDTVQNKVQMASSNTWPCLDAWKASRSPGHDSIPPSSLPNAFHRWSSHCHPICQRCIHSTSSLKLCTPPPTLLALHLSHRALVQTCSILQDLNSNSGLLCGAGLTPQSPWCPTI